MNFDKKQRTERVIQFGEGGFLRGFVDWMLKKMEEKGTPLAKPSGCISGGDCAGCASAGSCSLPEKKES